MRLCICDHPHRAHNDQGQCTATDLMDKSRPCPCLGFVEAPSDEYDPLIEPIDFEKDPDAERRMVDWYKEMGEAIGEDDD